jgi:hypothetical protein
MMPPLLVPLFTAVVAFASHYSTPPRPRALDHITPFGRRRGGCTLSVESGSRIDEVIRGGVGGVLVTRPRRREDGSVVAGEWEPADEAFFYAAPEHCHDDMAALLAHRARKRRRRWQQTAPPPAGRPSKVWNSDNFTCSSLPCDGWIDNAGWEVNGEGHAFPKTISQFNATYVLPGLPKQLEAPPNCTFNYSSADTCPGTAYFIGLENSDGW